MVNKTEFLQWVALILTLWPSVTVQKSYPDSPSYTAAVVEYSPIDSSPTENNLGPLNANNYLKIIDKAAEYAVDIIVLPESSLSISTSKNATIQRSQGATYIPDPKNKIVPCLDENGYYEYSLTSMSCAAKRNKIYVLINHREKFDCTPGEIGCPADGFLIYNTNVVFDRDGQVIARYRKYNLFGEREKNITDPIPTTFKTDFGVTFGTFTCFDLLYQTPTLNLTRNLAITDILYPVHWISELPYFSAVGSQAAWAYANDVNFLASSYNNPDTASGGSGIYLGKQGQVKVISENRRANILVVAEIPKVINGTRKLNIDPNKLTVYEFTEEEISTSEKNSRPKWTRITDDVLMYSTELIDIKQNNLTKTVCDGDFCCKFEVKLEFDETTIKNYSKYYHYRFAIFNGTRVHQVATGGIMSCGIIACIDNTIQGCAHVFQDDENIIHPTTFLSLEITTPKIANDDIFFFPITMTQSMLPLNVTDFSYQSHFVTHQFSIHSMSLKNSVNNLLTFAIHGRNFALDSIPV